jgi:hypothetical protein
MQHSNPVPVFQSTVSALFFMEGAPAGKGKCTVSAQPDPVRDRKRGALME